MFQRIGSLLYTNLIQKAIKTCHGEGAKRIVFWVGRVYNEEKTGGDTMIQKRFSQETLKILACVTMLIDHVAAVFRLALKWRAIGRLSFPIFCFLLAEGAYHTRNPKKYALRLAIGALLSELVFDLALFGGINWGHQNVMLTLLFGFCALKAMEKFPDMLGKVLIAIPFALAAELLHTDYGWEGVALVALFGLTREMPGKWPVLIAGMAVLFLAIPSAARTILGIRVPIQMFGLGALVPIALYSGKKLTKNKIAQWAFYLFYPVHLLLLFLIRRFV